MFGEKMSLEKKAFHRSSQPQHFTIVIITLMFAGSLAMLGNNKSRPLLKFCFNSRDQFVQAQCVLCDFYQFSATVLGCNGRTSALMSNITSTEAVCIISNCLQQVRQGQPQFSGRKRRDADGDEVDAKSEPADVDSEDDFEKQGVIEEGKELAAVLPSMKELLSRYVMLDEKSLRELEEQVVDKIEVNIDADDVDYDS